MRYLAGIFICFAKAYSFLLDGRNIGHAFHVYTSRIASSSAKSAIGLAAK
jgi:hypothetical protein